MKYSGMLQNHTLCRSDERKFTCETCGHTSKTKSDLVKHHVKHVTERNFKCDKCDKSFKDNHALRKHTRCSHSDTPPVTCTVCKKVKHPHFTYIENRFFFLAI